MREIALTGRQYTWENFLENPTYEKLDRVLASVQWEHKFPLVTVWALQRGLSDHTPLLVDSGEAAHVGNKAIFSFELSWFEREGFLEMVASEWAKETRGKSNIERWQFKMRHFRQFLRGWAKNASGFYKVEKERLLHLNDEFDIKAEVAPLGFAECAAKREAEENLAKILREEEIKWTQRTKVSDVQEGHSNTKFIHLIVNGKHRKKKIVQIE